jgi:hypothetical protein
MQRSRTIAVPAFATALRSLLFCLLFLLATPVRAQQADPLASALAASRDLDFDVAATRLRAALAATGNNRLSDADRARALMHLGATELFRSRREPAAEAFRTLLALNPRYRPDEIVFPPEVSALFHEVRIGVRAVSVSIPTDAALRDPGDRLVVRVYSASLHQIRATVRTPSGLVVSTLHEGTIGDSLDLLWDARQGDGRRRAAGSYLLRVMSRAPDGRAEREVEIPLTLTWDAVDTLAPPPQPVMRAEATIPTGRFRPLAVGLGAAAIAAVLPSVVGGGDDASGMRFGVAGSIGIAGIIGVASASRPRPLSENISWNRAERERWQREADRIRAENDSRAATVTLRVRAGRATTTEITAAPPSR